MTHDLKCWPEPFEAVCHEAKRHEYRRDDRGGYAAGDVLLLREWNPTTGDYSGDEAICDVTYVSRGPDHGIPMGFAVMSITLRSIGRAGLPRG